MLERGERAFSLVAGATARTTALADDPALASPVDAGTIDAATATADDVHTVSAAAPAGRRLLIHCDLDAFFAAVEVQAERLDDRIPLIIGADPRGGRGRGIVSTCNYAAREYGIRSAMPISEAWRRCPSPPNGPAQYRRPRFILYKQASRRVMAILRAGADRFEPASIDEAYLDVTERCDGDWDVGLAHALALQRRIRDNLGLSASFGLAPTRLLAKMGSEADKPGGVTRILPDGVADFLLPRRPREVPGIGPASAQQLAESAIHTLADAADLGPLGLERILGPRMGRWLARVLEGETSHEVSVLRSRRSIGHERTYRQDTPDPDAVFESLDRLAAKVTERLRGHGIAARTVEVKLRYRGFETHDHSRSLPVAMDETIVFQRIARRLLADLLEPGRPVRLVGVRLSGLEAPEGRQATLDPFLEATEDDTAADEAE